MLKLKVKYLSIKTKLMILILVFLCIPFFTIGFLWYENATGSIEQNAIAYNTRLVHQIGNHLDAYFSDLERMTYPLATHPTIQKFIHASPDAPYDRVEIAREIEQIVFPSFLFGRSDVFGRSDIYGFNIITPNGTASYGGVVSEQRYKSYMDAGNIGKKYRIIGLTEVGDSSKVLTVVRRFSDMNTLTEAGLIVIDLYLDQISNIASTFKVGQTGFTWIMDAAGRIVYHPSLDLEGTKANAAYLEDFKRNKDKGYYFKTIDGEKHLLIYYQSPQTNWYMVSDVPLGEITGNMIQMRNLTIWIGSILVFFVLAVLSGFSLSLTRSLSHLQRLMKRAESGEMTVKAPESRRDEIGGLNRSFNHMVTQIRRLIEEVHTSQLREKEMQLKSREAVMQAMQAQINPHFLYNTLELINSHAILEGVPPISKMANALAKIFRYSIGNPREIVSLAEEINHVRTYLTILQERYPHLVVEDGLDAEALAKVQAVRLSVQPIVENAFKHGYERHKKRPDFLLFAARLEPRAYVLQIKDHGGGMEPEQRGALNHSFSLLESDPADNTLPVQYQNIGLINVHHRIRLAFGNSYGLFIAASGPDGTTIELRLPYAEP
ncbi:cache domain-containing sensor histidine kinase [Paenibacillus koleovorans]|uniref:cache domain-containing sensor histidine kinase n=1 Tax=Paenibacillus koleovorans TaxID=121608 RepID=UPI000FD807C9|nr:sensor histidine kinase [Paenibacillus koleovorans]